MNWRPEIDLAFVLLAAFTIGSGIAAISLRNLIHCALCFAVCLLGVAGLFLWLGAQFIGFAQVLVYVGAISILVVFAILLTRGTVEGRERFFGSPLVSGAIALLLAGVLLASLFASNHNAATAAHLSAPAPVLAIGQKLMTTHVLALEIIALMLTAALIGAVTLAMPERKRS
jgi:NADH:ubiquinone oxidoreductase subunit 6 (subunit J)